MQYKGKCQFLQCAVTIHFQCTECPYCASRNVFSKVCQYCNQMVRNRLEQLQTNGPATTKTHSSNKLASLNYVIYCQKMSWHVDYRLFCFCWLYINRT